MPKTRIKLTSVDINRLNAVWNEIKEIAKTAGAIVRGPVPLPTRRLKITTRKSPCGDGKATFDRYEMRIHKRVIDIPKDEKVLRQVMRIFVPKDVNMEIELID